MFNLNSHLRGLGLALVAGGMLSMGASAQGSASAPAADSLTPVEASHTYIKPGFFKQMDVAVSLGTTGIGLDLSTNLSEHFRLRAGVDYTPEFKVPMHFELESYSESGVLSHDFTKLQSMMKRLTGIDVDDRVDMEGRPTMTNFKLLVDYFPWADKGWHFTAGFYWGKSRIAKAINTMGDMPSLLAVNLYNHMYDYFMTTDFFDTPIYKDYYLDPFLVEDLRADLEEQGTVGIHVGDYKDGTPYLMQPDADGMVKANAYVNAFKPYLGAGYGTELTKDGRFKFEVDGGVLFWGGTPEIITHDGVNMSRDLEHIKGKVGDYVDIIKTFKVYPMLSVRFSYTIF